MTAVRILFLLAITLFSTSQLRADTGDCTADGLQGTYSTSGGPGKIGYYRIKVRPRVGTLKANLRIFRNSDGSIRVTVQDPDNPESDYKMTFKDTPQPDGSTVTADQQYQQYIKTKCGDSITVNSIPENDPTRMRAASPNLPFGQGATADTEADLDGDGIRDSIKLEFGTLKIVIRNADDTRKSASQYTLGSNSDLVEAGDFNGDGRVDLVVSPGFITTTNTIRVFLSNSDGTLQPAIDVPSGIGPSTPIVADLNGDGLLDIAVSNPDAKTASVMFGNGAGGFAAPVSYPTNSTPTSMVAADFTGDGKPELAMLDATNNLIVVLINKGDGTFQSPITSQGGLVRNGTGYLAYADASNDGKLDIFALYPNEGVLSLLVGTGDGRFLGAKNYITPTFPQSVSVLPLVGGRVAAFMADDVTGDLFITGGAGDGTLDAPRAYRVGQSLTGVAAGDLNGDQYPDVVEVDGTLGTMIVQLNDGKGGLGIPSQYSLNISGSSSFQANPQTVALGDLNGDGNLDAVAGSAAGLQVLLGHGDGTFGILRNFNSGNIPGKVVLADLNGDGKLDAVVSEYFFASHNPGTIVVMLGDGIGGFGSPSALSLGTGRATGVAVADVNKDGKLDVVVVTVTPADSFAGSTPGNIITFPGKGDGKFLTGLSLNTTAQVARSFAVGDFNGDRNLDVAIAVTGSSGVAGVATYTGLGNGTFKFAATTKIFSAGVDLEALDLNGDGALDVINTDCCGETNASFLLGLGDGTFTAESGMVTTASPSAAAIADFNRDGKPDAAFAGSLGQVALLFNSYSDLMNTLSASPSVYVLAPEAIGTAKGWHLATETAQPADFTAPPTTLAGSTVTIKDSQGVSRNAQLFYSSPSQVNYVVPKDTALGTALVTVKASDGKAYSQNVTIAAVSPGIFALNQAGLAAANVLRMVGSTQTYENIYQASGSAIAAQPIDLGPSTNQVYLLLYGTGFRNVGTSNVKVTIGGVDCPVLYAGSGGTTPGLDQINLQIPRSLVGKGDQPLIVTAAGIVTNTVRVTIK